MSNVFNPLGQPLGMPVTDWQGAARPIPEVRVGRFCRLEPLNPSVHAEDLYAAFSLDSEGRNWTYLPYGPFESFEDFASWLISCGQDQDVLFFAIINQESNTPVGIASYLRISPEQGSIEVGHLNFSPLMQHTPIATEAMWLMMKEAFESVLNNARSQCWGGFWADLGGLNLQDLR